MVHIYHGVLLSHKKGQNWVICSDVDEPWVCHIEWSKSERDKQVSYTNAHTWNLEKWSWWTYLQEYRQDKENGLADTAGKKRVGQIETAALTYRHDHV